MLKTYRGAVCPPSHRPKIHSLHLQLEVQQSGAMSLTLILQESPEGHLLGLLLCWGYGFRQLNPYSNVEQPISLDLKGLRISGFERSYP